MIRKIKELFFFLKIKFIDHSSEVSVFFSSRDWGLQKFIYWKNLKKKYFQKFFWLNLQEKWSNVKHPKLDQINQNIYNYNNYKVHANSISFLRSISRSRDFKFKFLHYFSKKIQDICTKTLGKSRKDDQWTKIFFE